MTDTSASTDYLSKKNYCPTCRESGKGDDPCVTNQSPCNICDSFAKEQQIKIKHRRRCIRKQKTSDPNTSKDDLDLLGDYGDTFSGSQADLEGAAENLFSSPPRPQPLRFESLSLKTPQTVSHTPGTALQNKIESRLEKSLGSTFNIQLGGLPGIYAGGNEISETKCFLSKKPLSRMLFRHPTLLKLDLNLDPVISLTLLRLGLLFLGHPTTRMFDLWTLTFMDLHFFSKCPIRACFQAIGY